MLTKISKVISTIVLSVFCLTQLGFAAMVKMQNLRGANAGQSAKANGQLTTALTEVSAPATGIEMTKQQAFNRVVQRAKENIKDLQINFISPDGETVAMTGNWAFATDYRTGVPQPNFKDGHIKQYIRRLAVEDKVLVIETDKDITIKSPVTQPASAGLSRSVAPAAGTDDPSQFAAVIEELKEIGVGLSPMGGYHIMTIVFRDGTMVNHLHPSHVDGGKLYFWKFRIDWVTGKDAESYPVGNIAFIGTKEAAESWLINRAKKSAPKKYVCVVGVGEDEQGAVRKWIEDMDIQADRIKFFANLAEASKDKELMSVEDYILIEKKGNEFSFVTSAGEIKITMDASKPLEEFKSEFDRALAQSI